MHASRTAHASNVPGAPGVGAFLGTRKGNVSIEMAFLATFLMTLVLGAYDFGRFALGQAGVTQAARAGTQYAVLDQANATDTQGMIQAARDEAGDDGEGLSIAARNFCRCPDSSNEVSCANNCSDGQYPPLFVEVTVQDSLDLLFDYPGVSQTQQLSSISTIRVR